MSHLTLNQPLPPNPFTQSNEGLFYNAYKCCLDMEHDHSNPDDLYLVHARCLGYLITELPPNGRKAVADEINLCCKKDEDLKNLSEYYIDSLIRLCEPSFLFNYISSNSSPFQSRQINVAVQLCHPLMENFLKVIKHPLRKQWNQLPEITPWPKSRYV